MEQEPIEQKLYQPLSLQILAAQNVINNIDDYDEKELAAVQDIDEMFKKVPGVEEMLKNQPSVLQEKPYKCLYNKLSDDHEYAYVKNIPDGESFITKKSDPSSQFYHKISGNYSHVEDFCFSPSNKYCAYKTTFLANRPNMVFVGKMVQEEPVAVKPDMPIRELCFINEETLGVLSFDAFHELDITAQQMQKKCEVSHLDYARLYKMGQILIICNPYDLSKGLCWHLIKNKPLPLIFDDVIFQEDRTKLSAVNDNLISLINGTSAHVYAVSEQADALQVNQIACLPHEHRIVSLAIHPSGKFLVTGTDLNEGMIRLWDIQTQKVIAVSNFGPRGVSDFDMWVMRGNYSPICDLSWSKDGKSFMVQNGLGEAYEFNMGNYLSLVKAIRVIKSKTKKTNNNNNNNNNHSSNQGDHALNNWSHLS